MDNLVETGSRWFCAAAHVVGSSSFEMQACGGSGSRYAVGLASVAAVSFIVLCAVTRLVAGRAERVE